MPCHREKLRTHCVFFHILARNCLFLKKISLAQTIILHRLHKIKFRSRSPAEFQILVLNSGHVFKIYAKRFINIRGTFTVGPKSNKKCNLGKPHFLPKRLKLTFFKTFSNGVVPKVYRKMTSIGK